MPASKNISVLFIEDSPHDAELAQLALERSGYFPAMTLSLIKSGESSGTLDDMLERAAETQERELEARIAMVMGVFEPLLILTMGAVVLVIVLAILLPIFELNQLVN